MIERKTLPLQLHTGKQPLEERFDSPLNYGSDRKRSMGFMKPIGGLWTSTYETAFEIGWPSWSLGERFHVETLNEAWLLQPAECRVIELAGFPACHAFMQRYGRSLYSDRDDLSPELRRMEEEPYFADVEGVSRFELAGSNMMSPVWEDVAQDADAVRLLTPYAENVRLGPYMAFYGWDCESTVWLRWCFDGPARRVDLTPQIESHRGWWDDDEEEAV